MGARSMSSRSPRDKSNERGGSRSRSRRSRSRSRSRDRRGGGGLRDSGGKREAGIACKWNDRGFGFIRPNKGGEDVFCHVSGLKDGNMLREGDEVEFEVVFDERQGKYRAAEVTGGIQDDGYDNGGRRDDRYGGRDRYDDRRDRDRDYRRDDRYDDRDRDRRRY